MQPFQCDLQTQTQETHRTTYTGTSSVAKHIEGTKRPQPHPPHRRGTFHRRLQPLYTEKHKVSCSGFLPTTKPTQHSCSHSNAICKHKLKKRIELRTQEHPVLQNTLKERNDPSRTRRTDEVPFIVACSHFTRKNTRFRAPASSPQHSPCNIHAAITMRSAIPHHFPSSPLPFLTTSHRHHFPSSSLPIVSTSIASSLPFAQHFPSSPLPFLTTSHRHHFPSSPLPIVTTSLPHHFPSSAIPSLLTSLPHHFPSPPLPFLTTSHRHHFPSSPLPFITTSLRHHFPSSPLPFLTTSHRRHFPPSPLPFLTTPLHHHFPSSPLP